jgi:predicted PurR-regulated permease PerM
MEHVTEPTGTTYPRTRRLPPPWDRIFPVGSRLFVWSLLFSILYLLRSFSLLIFLTFVFAYIQAHAVDGLKGRIQSRILRVFLVAAFILSIIIGIGSFIFPKVKEQGELFASRYTTYLRSFDTELVSLTTQYPILDRITPETKALQEHLRADGSLGGWTIEISPTAHLIQLVFGNPDSDQAHSDGVRETIKSLREFGAKIIAVSSAFLLSLLFSFLIVLDLPKLARSVQSLENSKLRFIYLEVAESIRDFSLVLGRALEAQLFIAMLNTLLTGVGIYFLGLGANLFFLSMVVFLCSFIPVAGVFLSSLPICLLALQESGVSGVILSICLILLIHFIEAYFLNPKIFGKHLRINPVLVLMILTIGGKLFGVWGLVLGLPTCTYIFTRAIREKSVSAQPLS